MNDSKLTIKLGDREIVAEIYPAEVDESGEEVLPAELCVYIRKGDSVEQDICKIRPHSRYIPKKGKFEVDNDFVECFVWHDSNSEDYTDEFVIGVYKYDDEDGE